jgi:ankyrin repeat protein
MSNYRRLLNESKISLLVESPDWIRTRDEALCYAAAECSAAVVKTLIEHGANPVFMKDAPLYIACDNNNEDVVRYLLTLPAVCKNASENLNRSLFAAQRNKDSEIEALLLVLPNVAAGPSMHKPGFGLV